MSRFASSSTLLQHLGWALVAALATGMVILFVDPYPNYQLAEVGLFAIAAAGLTVLTGFNGQLSLGHGALMAIGAYTTALLLRQFPGLAVPVVMLGSIAAAGLASIVVGAAAARLRGPYLAGATLALAVGLPGVAIRFSKIFGGDQGISVPPIEAPSFLGADFPPERWLALVSMLSLLVAFVILANLTRSRFGRDYRAVRDDEIAAALAGIRVAGNQVSAFVVSGCCAGLAGSLFAYWAGLTAPSGFSLPLSLQVLAAVVIGGLGSLAGALWGAVAVVYLPPLSSSLTEVLHLPGVVKDNLPLALYGAAFVVTMLAFPHGIQGGLRLLYRKLWTAIPSRRDI